ncbi:MAG: zinc-finger domain-containing protein [Rhodospirillales bacterium]|nr:zinc-finger domain-containing protein [Rhodospirillales bacterium]
MPDVNTITDEETFIVDSPVVGCDGGGGALGHPLVYLRIERDGEIACPYCSRRFVLAEGAQPAQGH